MKKLLLFGFNFCFVAAMGQNLIRPITISLPPNPKANTADWVTSMPPVVIMAQTRMDSGRISPIVTESKILVTIKGGGTVICGSYNQQTALQSNFNSATKTWSGAAVTALLGKDCVLKPGTYELCVQFYASNPRQGGLLGEACKSFTIADTKEQSFSPPQNIMPVNGKEFSIAEAKQPIIFRWAPVLPKPKEDIIYKVRVIEIKAGQEKMQALNTNAPLIEKEARNETQLFVTGLANSEAFRQVGDSTKITSVPTTSGGTIPHPRFMWIVQATGTSGTNYGTSEATVFSVQSPCSPDYEFVKDNVYCGDDGKVHVKGHIKITPKPTITINQISLTEIKETNYSGANVSTSISILPKPLTATGNNYYFDFIINSDMCNKDLYIGYNISSTCSTTGQTTITPCGDIIKNLPCCTCTFCDQFKDWGFGTETVTAATTAPYNINVSTVITSPSITIKSFKAELVSFIHNGMEECFGCNKDPETFGNFIGGTFGPWGNGVFPLDAGNTTHHTLNWFDAGGGTTSLSGSPLTLSFTAPPLSPLKCCDDEIKFCIRYSFTDKECRTCSFIKCYTVKRIH